MGPWRRFLEEIAVSLFRGDRAAEAEGDRCGPGAGDSPSSSPCPGSVSDDLDLRWLMGLYAAEPCFRYGGSRGLSVAVCLPVDWTVCDGPSTHHAGFWSPSGSLAL